MVRAPQVWVNFPERSILIGALLLDDRQCAIAVSTIVTTPSVAVSITRYAMWITLHEEYTFAGRIVDNGIGIF
jgi:hypothetical protein